MSPAPVELKASPSKVVKKKTLKVKGESPDSRVSPAKPEAQLPKTASEEAVKTIDAPSKEPSLDFEDRKSGELKKIEEEPVARESVLSKESEQVQAVDAQTMQTIAGLSALNKDDAKGETQQPSGDQPEQPWHQHSQESVQK